MENLTMNEYSKKKLDDTYLVVYAIKNEIKLYISLVTLSLYARSPFGLSIDCLVCLFLNLISSVLADIISIIVLTSLKNFLTMYIENIVKNINVTIEKNMLLFIKLKILFKIFKIIASFYNIYLK